ncbi:pyruvate dehydrogenase complex E1 component subunit beta [Poseidonocella sedimentorum]|uniref:Pyruvate dehydrogenase E1 component subunit beta n=1 Tax=Poseidonocella sedimentorum TaxID=871652 RepID=A0A1I6DH40_9RHOB|nr:pyruvate dehydrogenase complex E1 component subunit beta [Poseidonocella sedimentorum]SFR04707.1 pyruvate dehydrogenase E1 component beta subunit [Poseidonocella sedimentorum]
MSARTATDLEIRLPALSPTMESGRLAKWYVSEGDRVAAGDVLAEIETDKATMEFEAETPGTISRLLIPAGGEPIPVDTALALFTPDTQPATQPPRAPEAASAADAGKEAAPAGGSDAPAPAAPQTPAARKPDTSWPQPDWPAATPTRPQTVRDALRDALAEEMHRDAEVFLIGEEVGEHQGAYKVSRGLRDDFGAARVVDTPITEQGFTGLAIGAAFAGLKPVVEFMSFAYALPALGQIVQSAAKARAMTGGALTCPITFRGPNGAPPRVAAQHGTDLAAWAAQIPGLKVAMPYTAADAKGLLKAAIRDPDPVIFLEHELLYGESFDVPTGIDHILPFGRAAIRRPGSDVTLVAAGLAVRHALHAAEALAAIGISAEVIDLRSLRPIDYDTILASLRKTNRCVTVEEGWPVASLGDHLAARITQRTFDWLDAPVLSATGEDIPLPYAANLDSLARVSVEKIVALARQTCYK